MFSLVFNAMSCLIEEHDFGAYLQVSVHLANSLRLACKAYILTVYQLQLHGFVKTFKLKKIINKHANCHK